LLRQPPERQVSGRRRPAGLVQCLPATNGRYPRQVVCSHEARLPLAARPLIAPKIRSHLILTSRRKPAILKV